MYLSRHVGSNIVSPETEEMQNRSDVSPVSSVIDFSDLPGKAIRTTTTRRRETPRIGTDNSTVETMFDGYGNQIENRAFYNDELLKLIVVRTSADGQKQALVYGQNGEIKPAPLNILNNILALPANEIARTVQIFEGRPEIKTLPSVPDEQILSDQPLTADVPTTNSEIPIVEEAQNDKPQPTVAEQVQPPDKMSPETIKTITGLSKNNLSARTSKPTGLSRK